MAHNFPTKFRGDSLFTPNEKITIKSEPPSPEEYEDKNQADNFSVNRRLKKSLSTNDIASLENLMELGSTTNDVQGDIPGRLQFAKPQTGRFGLTVPQSPHLRSKMRSRPIHVLSREQKEKLELEEIKKYKFKANPIKKSVLTGAARLPGVSKKPPTVPQPFKLTEVTKKSAQSPHQQQEFKTRCAPKPADVPQKRSHFVDRLQRPGPVKPVPFSFEKRDEEIKRRREERIKQQIEEERKQASQFKAQPLPGAVKKLKLCGTAKGSSSSTSENEENKIKFAARPPTVCGPDVQAVPLNLTVEKRAADEQNLKEKRKRLEQQKEKEIKETEEKERAELRAKLVHHAKPAPVVTPFIPEKCEKPLTIPKSPEFSKK